METPPIGPITAGRSAGASGLPILDGLLSGAHRGDRERTEERQDPVGFHAGENVVPREESQSLPGTTTSGSKCNGLVTVWISFKIVCLLA